MRTAKILIRWADAQAYLSLRWAHRPHCWFCHEAAQIANVFIADRHPAGTVLSISSAACNFQQESESECTGAAS